MLSQYAQQLLKNSTCCHSQQLTKNGKEFIGIYNGLSSWARVEDGKGNLVIELGTEWDEEENYHPSFTLNDFIDAGFVIVNPPEWLKQNALAAGA